MSWYPGGSNDSDRLNPPSNRMWWHGFKKKYIELKENHAYSFYFNKWHRVRDEPEIITERPVIFEDDIIYSKLFSSQWEIYELSDYDPYDVIFNENNKSEYVDAWILNDKVYIAKRVKPDYVKNKLRGFKQISIFDLEDDKII